MAKTAHQHEVAIIRAIEKYKIKRIAHIFRYYTDIAHSQFYNLGLDKSEGIKNALAYNRETRCADAIEEMLASDNPTLKLAGYKLICSDDDRAKLATTAKIEASVDGKLSTLQPYIKD